MKLYIQFKVFPDGDVIALFPNETTFNGYIQSYQRIGQHGDASPELLSDLRTATDQERAALLTELKSIYRPTRVTTSGVPGDGVLFWDVQ